MKIPFKILIWYLYISFIYLIDSAYPQINSNKISSNQSINMIQVVSWWGQSFDNKSTPDNLIKKALSNIPAIQSQDWAGKLKYKGTDWSKIFIKSMENPELRGLLLDLVASADKLVLMPRTNYVRPNRLTDIPTNLIDSNASGAGDNREVFALAMYDCFQTNLIRSDGPVLAVAALYASRYSDTTVYLDRVIDMLEELCLYSPMQRPGWTLSNPKLSMPAGGDGVWLATSWGIESIVEILDILGDKVPESLRLKLRLRLKEEINLIVESWANSRPWYVRSQSVATNQWSEPISGLIKACLYLQDPDLLPAYNFGVRALSASLLASGNDGAYLEGFTYAQMSVNTLLKTVAAMKANGDKRCSDMPFTQNSWRWFVAMPIDGISVVNCSDSKISQLPKWQIETPNSSMIEAALVSDEPEALITMKSLFQKGDSSISGIRYTDATIDTTLLELPSIDPFKYFPSQQLLVWRSTWGRPSNPGVGLALWLKGGSLQASNHGHRDQGQVSIYWNGFPILIDCGTPDYADPRIDSMFANVAGHGIMQVGEILPRGVPVNAPIKIEQLDINGGHATIDTTSAYKDTKKCTREIEWIKTGKVKISDYVEFKSKINAKTELYRFHTGSAQAVDIIGSGKTWTIQWGPARITITADKNIEIKQAQWPDYTRPPFHHQAVMIYGLEDTINLKIITIVELGRIEN